MSLSNSRLAYGDCYELLDRALDEPRGLRIEVRDENAATYLRLRIHHARTIDRQENKVTYADPDHPLHGRSPYDIFVCRIEVSNGSTWLWLDRQKVEIGRVESIPVEAQIEYHPTETRLLEGPKGEVEMIADADVEIIEPKQVQPRIRRR